MVASSLWLIQYPVLANGWYQFAIVRNQVLQSIGCLVLANGAITLQCSVAPYWWMVSINLQLICCLVIAKGCYQIAVLRNNVWRMVATNFQCLSYLTLANGCYRSAFTRSSVFRKCCYQFTVSSLPSLNKWVLPIYMHMHQCIGKWLLVICGLFAGLS